MPLRWDEQQNPGSLAALTGSVTDAVGELQLTRSPAVDGALVDYVVSVAAERKRADAAAPILNAGVLRFPGLERLASSRN